MNNSSTSRELFSTTILKQVKIKVSGYELELLLDVLKYMVLMCDVGVLEEKVIAFNTYKLIMRLQSKLFSTPGKQHTITLNISECYSIRRAYLSYPQDTYLLAKVYMAIDSRVH